jgi:hypothetical protein
MNNLGQRFEEEKKENEALHCYCLSKNFQKVSEIVNGWI